MRLVLVEVRVRRGPAPGIWVWVTAPLRPSLQACGDHVPRHTDIWHTGETVTRHGLRHNESDAATGAAHEERSHLRR